MRPFACEPASVRDPERDLKTEVRSVIPEAEPIEVLKLTVRPLKKDAAKPRESDKDLKSEVCSKKVEAEPIVAPSITARPSD